MLSKIPTQFTEELFELLGLTLRHATIYYALLKLGDVTITKIAKYTSIPRSTIYELMSDLSAKGLVNYISTPLKSVYIAEPPHKLLKIVEGNIKRTELVKIDLDKYVPLMQSEYSVASENFAKVKFFQGEESIKAILDEINNGDEILIIRNDNNSEGSNESNEINFMNMLAFELKKRSVKAKEILKSSESNNLYKTTFETDIHEVKSINSSTEVFLGNIVKIIYKDKFAYFNVNAKTMLLIEDASLVNIEKELFLIIWHKLR